MSLQEFAHGVKPTAAQFNAIKTALDLLNTQISASPINMPAEWQGNDSRFWVTHVFRYLHFGSTGILHDTAGVYPDTSLSEGDGNHGVLDLDSLGWLAYGRVYEVTGCTWCQEDSTA
jgi:hypothetical protein